MRQDAPYETLDDLIADLKANPQSKVEAVGIGSVPHFVGAMLAKEAEFETRLVTANSGADRLRLLLGGSADIALFAAQEYMAQGDGIKPLVYFGAERLPQLPDLPTAKELGYDVVWSNPNWWLASAGAPDEAVEAIAAALDQAIQDPEIVAYFEGNTLSPYWTGGEDSEAESRELLEQLKAIAADLQ